MRPSLHHLKGITMIKITFKKHDKLKIAIDNLLDEMEQYPKSSEEYATMTDQLQKLYETNLANKTSNHKLKETGMIVAGNLAGVLAIVHFEQLGVITSKALPLLMKAKF